MLLLQGERRRSALRNCTFYVDDGFVFASEGCAEIEAELDALAKRFKIKIVDPKQSLGLNVDAKTEDSEMKVSMRAYIDKIVGDCLTKPLAEWTPLTTPCKPKLLEAYEAAKEKAAAGERPSEALQKRYRTKLGKLMFASSSGVRADLAYGVGICARCASYPTSEMEAHLEHQAAYAGQTSSDGVVFAQDDAAELIGYSDSDWHVAHSTSAHCIMFGKACVGYGSRRQHCISMSSTEAEVIAASQAALEMVYMRKLLREMGYELGKPTILYVDNTAERSSFPSTARAATARATCYAATSRCASWWRRAMSRSNGSTRRRTSPTCSPRVRSMRRNSTTSRATS